MPANNEDTQRAYNEGWEAYESGVPESQNPYTCELSENWIHGWRDSGTPTKQDVLQQDLE